MKSKIKQEIRNERKEKISYTKISPVNNEFISLMNERITNTQAGTSPHD